MVPDAAAANLALRDELTIDREDFRHGQGSAEEQPREEEAEAGKGEDGCRRFALHHAEVVRRQEITQRPSNGAISVPGAQVHRLQIFAERFPIARLVAEAFGGLWFHDEIEPVLAGDAERGAGRRLGKAAVRSSATSTVIAPVLQRGHVAA